MVKIKIGGWSFNVKNKWSEVTYKEAKRLAETEEHEIRKRVNVLMTPPLPDSLKVDQGHLLALYEICSFVTEMPLLVNDSIVLPSVKTWKFRDFEKCRQAIVKHPEELALAFPRICDVLDFDESKYLEVGAKAMDAINEFTRGWEQWGIFDDSEPSREEVNAGIERLQAFGVFSMLDRLAVKYGVTPEQVEEWPTNDVFVKWTYLIERSNFESNMSKV
jgi:hypothetical protein